MPIFAPENIAIGYAETTNDDCVHHYYQYLPAVPEEGLFLKPNGKPMEPTYMIIARNADAMTKLCDTAGGMPIETLLRTYESIEHCYTLNRDSAIAIYTHANDKPQSPMDYFTHVNDMISQGENMSVKEIMTYDEQAL